MAEFLFYLVYKFDDLSKLYFDADPFRLSMKVVPTFTKVFSSAHISPFLLIGISSKVRRTMWPELFLCEKVIPLFLHRIQPMKWKLLDPRDMNTNDNSSAKTNINIVKHW